MACKTCKKKAEQDPHGSYRCPVPTCQSAGTTPRYLLSFKATYDTVEGHFFAYDDEAQQLVQKECESIFNPQNARDVLPVPLQKIVGKKFILYVDLTNQSCKTTKHREYQVKAVLQRPSAREVPQSTSLIQYEAQHEATTSTAIGSPSQQTDPLQIDATIQETPPPTLHTPQNTPMTTPPMLQTVEDTTKNDGKRSTQMRTDVRRRLIDPLNGDDESPEEEHQTDETQKEPPAQHVSSSE